MERRKFLKSLVAASLAGTAGASELAERTPPSRNGNEIADNSLNTFFAPVESVARARKTVDWARALQPAGRKRLALIRKLASMRHGNPVFADGTQEWVVCGEELGVVAFVRRTKEHAVLVAANLQPQATAIPAHAIGGRLHGEPIVSESFQQCEDGLLSFGPWGYVVSDLDKRD